MFTIPYIGLNSPRRRVVGIDLTGCYARQIGDRQDDGQGGAALVIRLDVVGDPGQDQGIVSVDCLKRQLVSLRLITIY
jgi:hypothetical protein